ncbi:MAG: metalloprotease [Candidatus Bathyarchaeia archaeon]
MGIFRKLELKHLLIAWLVLGICFSARELFSPMVFPIAFAIALMTVGVGFIGHELAHKFTARKFGCWAEFRLWTLGLILALIFALASGGRFIFAVPGAVYITPILRPIEFRFGLTKKENGLISLAGVMANIAIALAFFTLTRFGSFLSFIGQRGFQVNLWLAAFNMLPFGPMDGQKVFSWSKAVWLGIAVPLWILLFWFPF